MTVILIVILAIFIFAVRWGLIGGLIFLGCNLLGLEITYWVAFLLGAIIDLLIACFRGNTDA